MPANGRWDLIRPLKVNLQKFMHAQQNVLTFVGKPKEKAEESRKAQFWGSLKHVFEGTRCQVMSGPGYMTDLCPVQHT